METKKRGRKKLPPHEKKVMITVFVPAWRRAAVEQQINELLKKGA